MSAEPTPDPDPTALVLQALRGLGEQPPPVPNARLASFIGAAATRGPVPAIPIRRGRIQRVHRLLGRGRLAGLTVAAMLTPAGLSAKVALAACLTATGMAAAGVVTGVGPVPQFPLHKSGTPIAPATGRPSPAGPNSSRSNPANLSNVSDPSDPRPTSTTGRTIGPPPGARPVSRPSRSTTGQSPDPTRSPAPTPGSGQVTMPPGGPLPAQGDPGSSPPAGAKDQPTPDPQATGPVKAGPGAGGGRDGGPIKIGPGNGSPEAVVRQPGSPVLPLPQATDSPGPTPS